MAKDDSAKAAAAAFAVMKALEPLSADDRYRVLQSAGALYGVGGTPQAAHSASGKSSGSVAHQGQENQAASAAPAKISNKRTSIVEFLQEKSPATNPQRIACFAYYREHVEGNENFSRLDLAAYFPQAKLPAPGPNYARDYNNAVKSAWIHDDGAKSYLTQKGEAAVSTGFDGKAKPRGATGAKKRKGGKAE